MLVKYEVEKQIGATDLLWSLLGAQHGRVSVRRLHRELARSERTDTPHMAAEVIYSTQEGYIRLTPDGHLEVI